MAARPPYVMRDCFDADPPLALLESSHGCLERQIAFVVCSHPLTEPGLDVRNTILLARNAHQFALKVTSPRIEDLLSVKRGIRDAVMRRTKQTVGSFRTDNDPERIDTVGERQLTRQCPHARNNQPGFAMQVFGRANLTADGAGKWENELDVAIGHNQPSAVSRGDGTTRVRVDPRDHPTQFFTWPIKADAHGGADLRGSQFYNTDLPLES